MELRKETEKRDLGYHLSLKNKFLVSGKKGTRRGVISEEIMKEKFS